MKQFCQSCGMPLSQDPKNGGTNSDDSPSTEYCSYCYQSGSFLAPDFTAQQMQALCMEKMQEQGTWKPLAWLLTRHIPRLRRWAIPLAAHQH